MRFKFRVGELIAYPTGNLYIITSIYRYWRPIYHMYNINNPTVILKFEKKFVEDTFILPSELKERALFKINRRITELSMTNPSTDLTSNLEYNKLIEVMNIKRHTFSVPSEGGDISKCKSTGRTVMLIMHGKTAKRVIHLNKQGTQVVKDKGKWVVLSKQQRASQYIT